MIKKTILLLFLILGIHRSYAHGPDKVELLKYILNMKEFIEVLSLDDKSDMAPIRIVDNSKRFKNLSFSFKSDIKQKAAFLSVLTISKIPMDWNMGYNRDLYIDSYKRLKNGNYKISIYLTNYLCVGKKKAKLVFHGECSAKDGSIQITNREFNTWH